MTIFKPLPPLEIVESYLDYNSKTGICIWKRKTTPFTPAKVGSLAGTITNGYLRIKLFGRDYAAHRLFWLLHYKQDPGLKIVDHIDKNRSNNKIANLRLVTRSENGLNASLPSNNTTGVVGVSYCNTNKKFFAAITINYKKHFLGYFEKIEDAVAVRKKAEIMYM